MAAREPKLVYSRLSFCRQLVPHRFVDLPGRVKWCRRRDYQAVIEVGREDVEPPVCRRVAACGRAKLQANIRRRRPHSRRRITRIARRDDRRHVAGAANRCVTKACAIEKIGRRIDAIQVADPPIHRAAQSIERRNVLQTATRHFHEFIRPDIAALDIALEY
jgi:hypothetical protein